MGKPKEDTNHPTSDTVDSAEENDSPRLMRACDNCRRKKVKCDGTKPSCSHCSRMKLACHYSPLVRKKRVRRTMVDKLEERLESMEQLLQPLVERLSPNDPIVNNGMGFGFGPTPLPALSHPLGLFQTQPFLQDPVQSLVPKPEEGPAMPPPEVVEEMLDIAISKMTPMSPPASLVGFKHRLHSGQLPEYLICAIISLAARFSTRPEFQSAPRYQSGREYARRAAELISGQMDRPDPDVVLCLAMLGLYEWGCGRGESAWTYTGMATRLAQRCRLHLVDEDDFTENPHDHAATKTWMNTEWRRRLWWHVYCGDRTSVIVASRPATMDDEDHVVDLPSHDYEWITGADPQHSKSEVPDCWWLVVELYRACGRISEFANRRRRAPRRGDVGRREMFDILDQDLEAIRTRFIPVMKDFPPQPATLAAISHSNMGLTGVFNLRAIYFNIHMMYHASKIILYRSELPGYQHEIISDDLINRAKTVCIEAAHQQADIIRWALDTVPVEDWDPRIGVWGLQGATIHVNAALSSDNQMAEQSRRDLEVHLRLHVASDQFYHFNMAIITMLHRVFNIRKQQKLVDSTDGQLVSADTLVLEHPNDMDPWVVPRCSSFLGFSYNQKQLRGLLNDAIKQTTYGPPDKSAAEQLTYVEPKIHHIPSLPTSTANTDSDSVQEMEKQQKLEELRARVVLLQQLNQPNASSSEEFLTNFAASLGPMTNPEDDDLQDLLNKQTLG